MTPLQAETDDPYQQPLSGLARWTGVLPGHGVDHACSGRAASHEPCSDTLGRKRAALMALVAHEIRNSLAPVKTGVGILLHPKTPPSLAVRMHGLISRQLVHIGRLLDDLLDVSAAEAGALSLRRTSVEVQAVFGAAIEMSLPVLDRAGHKLDARVATEGMTVDCDPTRMVQVVSNLLNNAAKYTPTAGHILLTGCSDGDDLVISVTDDGMGLPEGASASLFNLFSQLEPRADRREGGMGVGLAVVRQIVELHGGSVSALSAGLGLGSTFTIRLPLHAP